MTDSRSWFWLAIAGVTGWLVWLLAPVITPFAISAGLAYLSDPLVDRLERVTIRRWTLGRTTAVVLVFVLLFGLITLVLLFAIPRLVQQLAALVERIPEYLDWFVHTAIPWLSQRSNIRQNI